MYLANSNSFWISSSILIYSLSNPSDFKYTSGVLFIYLHILSSDLSSSIQFDNLFLRKSFVTEVPFFIKSQTALLTIPEVSSFIVSLFLLMCCHIDF